MPQIIASTYEIIKEIGSGGGGIVYLGRHLRLDKLIVLKADKRSLKASPEMLRREVDALKNLTHTYIPQVYDFVQEDGVVYTVMDYIEGESLDKTLKRRDQIPQRQVIEWACELLDALRYLHSRPPHGILHSDIKPANIMVTPQGDIRLIDFNIALALGEEGAVRVGRSLGYASPEHFGEDYTEGDSRTRTGGGTRVERQSARSGAESATAAAFHTGGTGTEILPDSSGHSQSASPPSSSGAPGIPSGTPYSSSRTVLLDVRSDIYSLGATLYHILTGERPAQKVQDIKPIVSFQNCGISPAVAEIITKAMNPNPDRRYQTAEEMLSAFEHLHTRDARARSHRRRIAMTAAAVLMIALLGSALSYVGLRQMNQQSRAEALAGESRDALREGDVDRALDLALDALPEKQGLLDPPYVPSAQLALTNALGVYDLTDGYKPFRAIRLESDGPALKPIKAKMSPDGTMAAALVNSQGTWQILIYDTANGILTAPPLASEASAMTDFFFLDDGTFLYAGQNGLSLYDLESCRELWSTGEKAADIALSADRHMAATVYLDEPVARVYAVDTGEKKYTVDLGRRDQNLYLTDEGKWESLEQTSEKGEDRMSYSPDTDVLLDTKHNLLELDAHGNWLAVSFADGAVRLFCLDGTMRDRTVLMPEKTDCVCFEGGFCGSYFAAAASGGTMSSFRAVDLSNRVEPLLADNQRDFHLLVDESGIYLSLIDSVSRINLESDDELMHGLANTGSEILSFLRTGNRILVTEKDGTHAIYDEDAIQIAQLESDIRVDDVSFGGDYVLLYNRDTPVLTIQRWETCQEKEMFSYDLIFHEEARVHTDKMSAMLFSSENFRVIGLDGTVLAEQSLHGDSPVYDKQYRRQGTLTLLEGLAEEDFLEVRYFDGTIAGYSAKTGELVQETKGQVPDTEQFEEIFETERFHIVSPVNGTPAVYSRDGNLIRELEPDTNVMYAVEYGDGLLLQNKTAEQDAFFHRFGQLLNKDLEVTAVFPDLTDLLPDGTLVFDDTLGTLRQCRMYTIENLIAMGKQRRSTNE